MIMVLRQGSADSLFKSKFRRVDGRSSDFPPQPATLVSLAFTGPGFGCMIQSRLLQLSLRSFAPASRNRQAASRGQLRPVTPENSPETG